MDELLRSFSPIVILVVVLGSIVDIFQFFWIVKASYKKMRERMYDKIRGDILDERRQSKRKAKVPGTKDR